jgi:putative transposase
MEGMKISEIAKILQVHKSTVYRWINEFQRGRKMPIPQGKKRKKKEGKREGNKSYVFATAFRLNITLLFLPPYSP